MSVSLHLKANLENVQRCLEPLLLPESMIILVPRQDWISIYAEQLSEDISDIEELAVPLSSLAEVLAVISERYTEVYRFSKGALHSLEHQIPTQLPREAIAEFSTIQTLSRAGLLPKGSLILEKEAEKPGLAEFFGRSEDE
jgi:hypothetical protein